MIQLTKIPHHKFKVIECAVKHYLKSLEDSKQTLEVKVNYSIAEELYYKKIFPKINCQFPAKKHSLKMLFHQARVLLYAFNSYQIELFTTDEHHATLTLLNQSLHRQVV